MLFVHLRPVFFDCGFHDVTETRESNGTCCRSTQLDIRHTPYQNLKATKQRLLLHTMYGSHSMSRSRHGRASWPFQAFICHTSPYYKKPKNVQAWTKETGGIDEKGWRQIASPRTWRSIRKDPIHNDSRRWRAHRLLGAALYSYVAQPRASI